MHIANIHVQACASYACFHFTRCAFQPVLYIESIYLYIYISNDVVKFLLFVVFRLGINVLELGVAQDTYFLSFSLTLSMPFFVYAAYMLNWYWCCYAIGHTKFQNAFLIFSFTTHTHSLELCGCAF